MPQRKTMKKRSRVKRARSTKDEKRSLVAGAGVRFGFGRRFVVVDRLYRTLWCRFRNRLRNRTRRGVYTGAGRRLVSVVGGCCYRHNFPYIVSEGRLAFIHQPALQEWCTKSWLFSESLLTAPLASRPEQPCLRDRKPGRPPAS